MTIFLVADTNTEMIKCSVESVRMFADVDNLEVILIDTGAQPDLREWAANQEDITYVYMDEDGLTYGQTIKHVWKELEIEDDILLMSGNFCLTPMCLTRLNRALYGNEQIGVAGPVSNGLPSYQHSSAGNNYEEAVSMVQEMETINCREVMGLFYGAMFIKKEVFQQLGFLDENLISRRAICEDFSLKVRKGGWKIKVCEDALFWCAMSDTETVSLPVADRIFLENKWGMHYFNFIPNYRLIEMMDKQQGDEFNVLEVGCDCGATLLEVKNCFPNVHVFGSELNDKAASIASCAATVCVNNIEEQNLPFKEKMDYIIFGDVLEHLRNPLAAIQYCQTLLKENGCIIASIPNVMHISVMRDLLNGDFTYTETGLLDKTHIHLFTFNEIIRMFKQGNYEVEKVNPVVFSMTEEEEKLIEGLLALKGDAKRFMYETFQYVVKAKKKG